MNIGDLLAFSEAGIVLVASAAGTFAVLRSYMRLYSMGQLLDLARTEAKLRDVLIRSARDRQFDEKERERILQAYMETVRQRKNDRARRRRQIFGGIGRSSATWLIRNAATRKNSNFFDLLSDEAESAKKLIEDAPGKPNRTP